MFALTLLTFDHPYITKKQQEKQKTRGPRVEHSREAVLIKQKEGWLSAMNFMLYRAFQLSFRKIREEKSSKQLFRAAIFIENLFILPKDVQNKIISNSVKPRPVIVPQIRKIPGLRSKIHRRLKKLPEWTGIAVVDGFEGLECGAYRMDLALKKDEQAVAFIDICREIDYVQDRGDAGDGDTPQVVYFLKRDRLLKERLYEVRYPDIPLIRVHWKSKTESFDELVEKVMGGLSKLRESPPSS
jgi:hypothetical protein